MLKSVFSFRNPHNHREGLKNGRGEQILSGVITTKKECETSEGIIAILWQMLPLHALKELWFFKY